jgi:hypothetical protein
MANLPTRRKVFDLVGEGRHNPDGTSRQEELLESEPGERVEFVREPDNPADPNAILVQSCRGIGIGYIPRDEAVALAPAIDEGRPYVALLHCLKGGLPDYPNYGAQISIAWDGKPSLPYTPLDAAQERSRRGKRAMRGRSRDDTGRLASRPSSSSAPSRQPARSRIPLWLLLAAILLVAWILS